MGQDHAGHVVWPGPQTPACLQTPVMVALCQLGAGEFYTVLYLLIDNLQNICNYLISKNMHKI